ncbi:MAG: putative small nuclear ribonucleoprotein [Marine Group I thaumarchaeote]|nr:MAG: putative small nuclear ribonucleoprotein [Marine Group I thaumarchaeote]
MISGKTMPLSALLNCINKQVIIICKNGTQFIGRVSEVDEFMNIVLHDGQEYRNGNVEKVGVSLVQGRNISIIRLDDITDSEFGL